LEIVQLLDTIANKFTVGKTVVRLFE